MIWKVFGVFSLILAGLSAIIAATVSPEYRTGI